MPSLKKFPWVSLALLLVTYSTLGWLLSDFDDPWFVWAIVVIGVFLIAASLSSPWSNIRNGFAGLFKSDTRAFLFTVVAAFLTVLITTWFHLFAHALVVISACTLFRLDSQTANLSQAQVFWISTIVSLAGLGLGAVAHTVI